MKAAPTGTAVKMRNPIRFGNRKRPAARPSWSRLLQGTFSAPRPVCAVPATEIPLSLRPLLEDLLVLLKELVELRFDLAYDSIDALLAQEHGAEVAREHDRSLLPGRGRHEGPGLADVADEYLLDDVDVLRWGFLERRYRRLAGRVTTPGLDELLERRCAGYGL